MYLDQLPSIRVTELRRSGGLTPDMTRTAVTLQGDDGTPVSSEVQVVRVRMMSRVVSRNSSAGNAARPSPSTVRRTHHARALYGASLLA
jgi:hypothetical protein